MEIFANPPKLIQIQMLVIMMLMLILMMVHVLILIQACKQAIQGLVDATLTNFDIVTDPVLLQPRNYPLQWTAINEGWEFIPNNPANSYTINSVPFSMIPANYGSSNASLLITTPNYGCTDVSALNYDS